MRPMRDRRRRQAGFTLVELMISLVMFSLAIAGVLAVAVSMVQGYRETRMVIAAENAVRVPMEFMADALRQVSPGVPSGNIEDLGGGAGTCPVSALTVVNSDTGPDTLDIIYASGAVVTSSRTPFDTGTLGSLEVNDTSQLAAGDAIVITDLDRGHLVEISSISGNTLNLVAPTCTYNNFPTGGYVAGSIVVRARHAVFSIGLVDGIPTLMFDPDAGGPAIAEPLAEGVEDLQIAVGVDTVAPAGSIDEIGLGPDDDDWVYNVSGDTPLLIGALARAVRVTIVARSGLMLGGANYALPEVEDRGLGGADVFRRRILRTTIELRNMGGSP